MRAGARPALLARTRLSGGAALFALYAAAALDVALGLTTLMRHTKRCSYRAQLALIGFYTVIISISLQVIPGPSVSADPQEHSTARGHRRPARSSRSFLMVSAAVERMKPHATTDTAIGCACGRPLFHERHRDRTASTVGGRGSLPGPAPCERQ